jgi:pimeloyl-ACP methyl ester carboxylesterase
MDQYPQAKTADSARHTLSGPGLLELIERSPRMPLRDEDAAQLACMETWLFGDDANKRAWSIGTGRLVVLVHGWGGIGAQMAPLAAAIAAAGFRCVLFDALGHGQSGSGRIGFDGFGDDVAELCASLGENPYALIGHSAGALGMMAARYRRAVSAQQFVCLAMPIFPYVPLETLKAKFGFTDEMVLPLKPALAAQFDRSWAELEAGCVFAQRSNEHLTLVYDRSDPRVRHTDADTIAALWPGTRIIKTEGLGHNRILRSPEVIAAIDAALGSSGPITKRGNLSAVASRNGRHGGPVG